MTKPEPKSPEEELLEKIFGRSSGPPATPEQRAKLKKKIEQVLASLTFREREAIKLRYDIGDGYTYTLEQVEQMFKVTRERVREIERKAVRKLQHPVRARKILT